MNTEELHELAERAAGVDGRPASRLAEVHARIRATRRRRQAGALAATVVAIVLALTAGTAVVKLTESEPSPVTPPSPSPKPTPTPQVDNHASAVRPLVYARGSTIHVGHRTIDVGGRVWNVLATDAGAVYTRQVKRDCFKDAAGCNELWFTDGSEIVRIGTIYGSVIRGFEIYGSTGGSTVVWFEPSPKDHPHGGGYERTGEYVAYDTRERREVARWGSARSDVHAVFDDYVYWVPAASDRHWCLEYSRYYGECRRFRSVVRLDVSTGAQAVLPWSAYQSDRRSRPRMFVVSPNKPDAPFHAFPSNEPGDERISLRREGSRLVVSDGETGVFTARLASTGKPVRLRLPPGYADAHFFWVKSWLDDQRVVLQADNGLGVLVCRLPDGRCTTAARGPVVADFGAYG